MSSEQKKKYLENPNNCPFCGDNNIVADHFDMESRKAWREVNCLGCNKMWREVFTMTDVEE
jgi:transcription elongation factor Elf1